MLLFDSENSGFRQYYRVVKGFLWIRGRVSWGIPCVLWGFWFWDCRKWHSSFEKKFKGSILFFYFEKESDFFCKLNLSF